MDVPTVKNVRLALQTLELLSFPPERISVVLNRANSNVGIKQSEIENALATKVRFELPSDRAVPVGVNRGNPVVLSDPGADFARAMRKVAKEICAAPEVAKAKKRRLFAGRRPPDGPPRPAQGRDRSRRGARRSSWRPSSRTTEAARIRTPS